MKKIIALISVLALLVTVGVYSSIAKEDAKPAIAKDAKTVKCVTKTETKNYTLDGKATSIDKKGTISFHVKAAKGRKVNPQFPIKLILDPVVDVRFDKKELGKKDAKKLDGKELLIEAGYQVDNMAGYGKTVTGSFKFGTCEVKNGKVTTCLLHREKIEIAIPKPKK